MDFKLPKESFVNKFIPKSKFYEKAKISRKQQNEFVNKIQKITWKYKLSEKSIGVSKSQNVSEIQIFEIHLKEKVIPKNVLKIIDKSIPYQILYFFKFESDFAFGITLKENKSVQNYYFTDWNQELEFDFSGIDLEKIYQKLILAFIPKTVKKELSFKEKIALDFEVTTLKKEISNLELKVRKTKQFNKKVELHKILLEKRNELELILKSDLKNDQF